MEYKTKIVENILQEVKIHTISKEIADLPE